MEKPIRFRNKEGLNLAGILHLPDTPKRKVGILFVHSGVQGRHGNTNQYVTYAREFCKLGFLCLRFDPHGLGDSEGVINPMDMRDFYGSIQSGRYVVDTLTAINEFKQFGVEEIILFGLCGGSITALLTAPFVQNLKALILLSIPIMLDSSKINYDLRIPKEIAAIHIKGYLKKIYSPKYWIRLLTLKSNFSTIFSYLKALMSGNKKLSKKEPSEGVALVNSNFFEAYNIIKHNINILWIFGSNDSFWHDFKREFINHQLLLDKDELFLIEDANHMFTLTEWQAQIIEKSEQWLRKYDLARN